MRIKNLKLGLLTLSIFCLCLALGTWQFLRAQEKEKLIKSFSERSRLSVLDEKSVFSQPDVLFFHAELRGQFVNADTFLLDNKIHQGQVGYEVYTPFISSANQQRLLVDRGFVPLGKSRQTLPSIPALTGTRQIKGTFTPTPRYAQYGDMIDMKNTQKPLRLEYIQLAALSKLLKYPIFPLILTLEDSSDQPFIQSWQITPVSPERHYGYALQWFALALTLLLLLWAFNRADR